MLASTLYVRVVPADKDRGYLLLAGYEPNIVQRTALTYMTLTAPTRESLNAAIERMRANNSAAVVKDVTDSSVAKKLAKLFGEVPNSRGAATTAAIVSKTPDTMSFSGLGIGSYLQGE
jgi:hypothetical protein